jgi:hypothetical protein
MKKFLSIMATFGMGTSMALAGSGIPNSPPIPIDDAQLQLLTTQVGGADVLPTTRTVPHFWRSTLDPDNGVTYGYNMVGADPYGCVASSCSMTIEVDITPLVVNIDGMTFSGSDVLNALLASPLFALNDYGSTPYVTTGPVTVLGPGPGGVLSQGDAGQPLQLLDATMRAQFNQTGNSNYHLKLHPNVLPPVTINVPNNQGFLLQSERGVVFGAVDDLWWSAQVQNLETKADATHLALYLTDDLILYFGSEKLIRFCCVLGYHGTKAEGASKGVGNSNGNASVQTFAWASWLSPGIYAGPNFQWGAQDVVVVGHEITEWANDPFVKNTVEPWSVPVSPLYGCSSLLETGDPVDVAGFAVGTNTFRQGPNPDGSQSADGYYHPQDEAFLPWFMRLSPNVVSEPTQSPSPLIGRYTFMGDLNTFGFNRPAPGCS